MFLFGYSPNFLAAIGAFALIGMGGGAALTPMMGLLAPWFERQNRGLAGHVWAQDLDAPGSDMDHGRYRLGGA